MLHASVPFVRSCWLGALFLGGLLVELPTPARAGVAVLLVDTDRTTGSVDERIYGQFLEHINHSVVDGLYAEQIRGQGFEGGDFGDYWRTFADHGSVELVAVKFEQGERSVRFTAEQGTVGLRQTRVYLESGKVYDGSVWLL